MDLLNDPAAPLSSLSPPRSGHDDDCTANPTQIHISDHHCNNDGDPLHKNADGEDDPTLPVTHQRVPKDNHDNLNHDYDDDHNLHLQQNHGHDEDFSHQNHDHDEHQWETFSQPQAAAPQHHFTVSAAATAVNHPHFYGTLLDPVLAKIEIHRISFSARSGEIQLLLKFQSAEPPTHSQILSFLNSQNHPSVQHKKVFIARV